MVDQELRLFTMIDGYSNRITADTAVNHLLTSCSVPHL